LIISSSAGTSATAKAAEPLDAERIDTLEFSATGRTAMFGQAFSVKSPWVSFPSDYRISIDYNAPASRVEISRAGPSGGDHISFSKEYFEFLGPRSEQYVSGDHAWSVREGSSQTFQPQPADAGDRRAEIWSTPHGFLKAARRNNAQTVVSASGSEVKFIVDGRRFVGRINLANEVRRVQTWVDDPVLGETLIETDYDNYKDFGGVRFPSRITQTKGGHPVLSLTVTGVTANPRVMISVPESVRQFSPPPVNVTDEMLAPGVYYLRGAGHHSVAIAQRDHVIVVEAPVDAARSKAVMEKIETLIPNRPIKYVVNTHFHFDHSGGLRAYADAGITVVTHASNRKFFERAWARSHSGIKKAAKFSFDVVHRKRVLSDGTRNVEIHLVKGSPHSEGFLMVYLPQDKLVIEADAYSPLPAGVPPSRLFSLSAANLLGNIERLGLSVDKVVGIHGARVGTLADLQGAVAD